ncbi:conserved membrane hypothetical protein [Candidatus Desulfosporosinus infrequens]|uniref:DUF2784 family protein n=1 Tax=Candidatus Desulfosporosinus infrequens TaxID=2043169 RepID=A0A2U3KSN2_9FIRM|nr:conserved membrane hypothetical protein [Candidatus Desulfosporosinus infrequens]
MSNASKLLALKIVHTTIWVFYVSILVYMYYLVFLNKIDYTFWIAVFSVCLEATIVLIFGWKCPLTVYMERYVEKNEVCSDIFLPQWLAKYNKNGYSILFFLCLILAIYRITTY